MAHSNIDTTRYASMESRIPQPKYADRSMSLRKENREYSTINILQSGFQQRLLKEKEDNMIKIHQTNQIKALSKVKRYQNDEGYNANPRNNNRQRERGHEVMRYNRPPRDVREDDYNNRSPASYQREERGHEVMRYNRARNVREDHGISPTRSQRESPPFPTGPRQHHRPLPKNSAGRDKSNPLAPIENTERRRNKHRKYDSENSSGSDFPIKPKMARSTHRNMNQRVRYDESESDYAPTPDANQALIEQEIRQKERELLAKIQQQQVELDRIKRSREREEEEARREEERDRKHRAAKEAGRKRLQQKFNENTDPTPSPREYSPPPQRAAPPRERSPPPQRAAPPPKPAPIPVRQQQPIKRPPPKPAPPPIEENPYDEEEPIQAGAYDMSALGPDSYEKVDLKPCPKCGRKFAKDRIDKHKDACSKASKKRKVFDPVKMRAEGTEMAEYTVSNNRNKRKDPPKKKADWRRQHEDFIKNIRYAKQVTQAEAAGGDISAIAPPPRTENPDYVPCPHCNRTFNATAAERHIPKCKETKYKAAPPPRGTKR